MKSTIFSDPQQCEFNWVRSHYRCIKENLFYKIRSPKRRTFSGSIELSEEVNWENVRCEEKSEICYEMYQKNY